MVTCFHSLKLYYKLIMMNNSRFIACHSCGHVYDPYNAIERKEHDRNCDSTERKSRIKAMVRDEKEQLRRRCYSTNQGKDDMISTSAIQIDPSMLGSGSYTAKITQGVSSREIEEFRNSYGSKRNVVLSNAMEGSKSGNNTQNKRRRIETESGNDLKSYSEVHNDSDTSEANLSSTTGTKSVMNRVNESSTTTGSKEAALHSTETICVHQNAGPMFDANGIPISSKSLFTLRSRQKVQSLNFSDSEMKYIELMHLLSSINAPRHAFDKFVAWGRSLKKDDLSTPCSREKLISTTAEKFSLNKLLPTTHLLLLPSGNTVRVTKFCFMTNLFSLLSEEKLMQPSNFIFGEDILRRYDTNKPNDHRYGEINTGLWYANT